MVSLSVVYTVYKVNIERWESCCGKSGPLLGGVNSYPQNHRNILFFRGTFIRDRSVYFRQCKRHVILQRSLELSTVCMFKNVFTKVTVIL